MLTVLPDSTMLEAIDDQTMYLVYHGHLVYEDVMGMIPVVRNKFVRMLNEIKEREYREHQKAMNKGKK